MNVQKIAIIALLLFSSATYAQNSLSTASNALRADSLQQENINFVEAGMSGEKVIWEAVEASEASHGKTLMQVYDIDGQMVLDDGHSLTSYLPSADSMLISRIETPLYQMNYSEPIVAMTFPFLYGSSNTAPFRGTGDYEGKLALAEMGTNTVTADGYGSLILTEGDTLRNVIRVHTQRNADVTITGIVSDEDFGTLQKATSIYEWYARGYRYPVLRTIEEQISKDGTLLRTVQNAYCITPEEQELLDDLVNEDIRMNDSIAYAASNPVSNMHVETNGYSATLTYDLATDAHISMTLANTQGMVYWRYDAYETADEEHSHTILLSGLPHGQYIIHLNANGQNCSSKVNVE